VTGTCSNVMCPVRCEAVVLNVWSANYERPVEFQSHPGFFPLSQFRLFNFLAYSRVRCKPFPRNGDLLKFRCSFISNHNLFISVHGHEDIGGDEFPVHLLLTWALGRVEWSASHPGRVACQEREPGTYYVEDWVGVRADLDGLEKNLLLVSGF